MFCWGFIVHCDACNIAAAKYIKQIVFCFPIMTKMNQLEIFPAAKIVRAVVVTK